MLKRRAPNVRHSHQNEAQLTDLADTLTLTRGLAAALQSGLIPTAVTEGPNWLQTFGEGYFHYLGTLPLLAATRTAGGGHRLALWLAPTSLPMLRFAPPYLVASRGGRELRYPIIGGIMARKASGYIAFGHVPEAGRARVWVEVAEFWPRLGLGPFYILTEVVLHRLITVAYLRRVAASSGDNLASDDPLPG